ncbi:hypothetical protein MJT46_008934 [Ovis ammon polii x Ovis aries]|nr:hypothetical protein MJT46_008934 [Ovis ammon polii x Ovis aries]
MPGPTPRRSAHRLAFAVTLSGQLSLPSRALRMSWAARGRGRLGSEPTNFSPTPQRAGGRPGPRDHRGAGPALRDERARGAQPRDPSPGRAAALRAALGAAAAGQDRALGRPSRAHRAASRATATYGNAKWQVCVPYAPRPTDERSPAFRFSGETDRRYKS